ncbi:NADPH-dependent F420 reductase [Chitinophaga sp. 30R24]|uniref:NADPH-dependent F420 reductase n=1 Tax=Chitinophaga sp. 30R24 TaxID=3248838 RepID=UPI003B8EE693
MREIASGICLEQPRIPICYNNNYQQVTFSAERKACLHEFNHLLSISSSTLNNLINMKISIIGAGSIGGTLARKLTKLGHEVYIANSRGPETLTGLAQETGATPIAVDKAVNGVDLVIVTIPEKAVPSLSRVFAKAPDDLIIIDTCNYYPHWRDGYIAGIEESGMTESEWVQHELGRPIIKAFNNIVYTSLGKQGKVAGTPGRIALPVAGDNADHKKIVMQLIDELGFDPVDGGALKDSWRQQPGTPVYITNLDVAGLKRALLEADPTKIASNRASI